MSSAPAAVPPSEHPYGTPWAYLLSYEAGLDLPAESIVKLALTDPRHKGVNNETISSLQRRVEQASDYIGKDLRTRPLP